MINVKLLLTLVGVECIIGSEREVLTVEKEGKTTGTADFMMDTKTNNRSKVFSKKMKITLWVTMMLNGILALLAVVDLIWAFNGKMWKTWGISGFTTKGMMDFCIIICFVTLLQVVRNGRKGRTFSKELVRCIWIIGGLFIAASVVVPHMEGYQSSGFEILSSGASVFCDGSMLYPGLLLVVLGGLMKAGLELQKEIDEIL